MTTLPTFFEGYSFIPPCDTIHARIYIFCWKRHTELAIVARTLSMAYIFMSVYIYSYIYYIDMFKPVVPLLVI